MDKAANTTPAVRFSPASGILLIIFGTILLGLEIRPQEPLVPHAPVLMLALQVGTFVLIMPFIRLRPAPLSLAVVLLWLGLFTWSFLSGFWSEYPVLSFRRALTVFIPAFLLLLLVYSDRRPVETFWRVLYGLVYLGSFLAFAGILLFFAGRTIYLDQWEALQVLSLGPFKVAQLVHLMEPWNRISSLTGNPNDLASILVFSMVGGLALYLAQHLSFMKFIILSSLQGLALLLTLSRTGMGTLVLTAGILFLLLVRGAGKRFFLSALLAIIIVTGSVFLLNLYFHSPGEDVLVRSQTLFTMREYAWAHLWTAFKESPFSGSGFGISFEGILEPEGLTRKSHNVYLNTLSELGLPGFLLFMGVWLAALACALRRFQRASAAGRTSSTVAVGVVAALLVTFMVHEFFENVLLRFSFYNLLWVYLVGVASHPLSNRLKEVESNIER